MRKKILVKYFVKNHFVLLPKQQQIIKFLRILWHNLHSCQSIPICKCQASQSGSSRVTCVGVIMISALRARFEWRLGGSFDSPKSPEKRRSDEGFQVSSLHSPNHGLACSRHRRCSEHHTHRSLGKSGDHFYSMPDAQIWPWAILSSIYA